MVNIITVIQNCHNNSHMNKSKNNKTSYTKATNSKYKYHCGNAAQPHDKHTSFTFTSTKKQGVTLFNAIIISKALIH